MCVERATYSAIDRIVTDALEAHSGGEAFFSALDHHIRQRHLAALILRLLPTNTRNIVLSGRFGKFFLQTYGAWFENVLLMSGGIRSEGIVPTIVRQRGHLTRGTDYIFLDDSYYSGVTQRKISAELSKLGANLTRTIVLYNGCKNINHEVKSLIRYYR